MSNEKRTMSIKEAGQFVERNKYKIDEKTCLLSRCIDGRYDRVEGLPPLAIPGADAGQMCVIFSACRKESLQFDPEKVFKTLYEVVGGIENLKFHRDDHIGSEEHLAGCGYVGQVSDNCEVFGLNTEDVDFIKQKVDFAIENGAEEIVLHGSHEESAVLLLNGNYSVYPKDDLNPNEVLQTFVFHQSLMEKRTRILAQKLVENNAIFNIAESDLYNLLVKTTREHLTEIAKRLAKGLPTYKVKFEDNGRFDIK